MTHTVDVAIVGAGFSGLCMAIQLAREGERSFVVLEKSSAVGGTWRDNHYPGCACDVPAHLYSFSFAPNPRWSRKFAPHHEIRAYLEDCVERFGLGPHIQFQSQVTSASFDERDARWRVEIRDAEHGQERLLCARYLVFAVGPFSRPVYPSIEGREDFRGAAFHSAAWDHSVDLRGKRVAVVGTGASAIQIVPSIAPQVGQLHLFQRTPPWIIGKPDRRISRLEQRIYERFPTAQRLYRWHLYWLLEMRALAFTVEPRLMGLARALGAFHIRRQITDPTLRRQVTPSYLPGCKRILMADDYYPALERDNVELVTQPVERITESGVRTADGRERPVDVMVYSTGFDVSDMQGPIAVRGRGGVDLREIWRRHGAAAYLGTSIAGFPNLFMMLGPNTGLGHTSVVFMIEAQVHYAMACMRATERRGARALEVLERAELAFNQSLEPRLARSIWATGCQSWYLDASGRNVAIWPSFTAEFWLRTRRPILSHYRWQGDADDAADASWARSTIR